MNLEAIGKPFIYRWPGGEVRLEPGKPVAFSPERGAKLLARASGRVRQVGPDEAVVIEPAVRWDGSPLPMVYWERGDTSISGPATPLLFEQVGTDCVLVIDYRGEWISINANTLRSKKQFEQQRIPVMVERIKECR